MRNVSELKFYMLEGVTQVLRMIFSHRLSALLVRRDAMYEINRTMFDGLAARDLMHTFIH